MRTNGAAANAARSSPSVAKVHENLFVELCKPLPVLLAGGGDDRLTLGSPLQANMYGCHPYPTPGTLSFSSSTATSISERAYRRAEQAREELFRENIRCGPAQAFDLQIDRMRHLLRSCLKLDGTGTEIVFSPSGTDSQLHALLISRWLLGGPTTSIVIGAEQTGRGTAYTSHGRHFSQRTAQGKAVQKSMPVVGGIDTTSIGISLFSSDGQPRCGKEIDSAVMQAVAEQVGLGRKIILQTMESSKLGWRAPSNACLRLISATWPQDVQIVVDACQMRIGRPRLRDHLEQGHIVLVTGSKFFTGPAFSGASLWPAGLSERIAGMTSAFPDLSDYATRFDVPSRWSLARKRLPTTPNFGQWLRWEAAIEEMRGYYALPDSYRQSALAYLACRIPAAITSSQHLKLLIDQGDYSPSASWDEEMCNKTIFSFLIERNSCLLGIDEMTNIYHTLNLDISDAAAKGNHALASVCCHVGQPVETPIGTILRIGVGARLLTEAWSADSHIAEERLRAIGDQAALAIRKVDLIVSTNAHLSRIHERQ